MANKYTTNYANGKDYSNENMHRIYYVNEDYRMRRFDDIEVGDKIPLKVNQPDVTVTSVVAPVAGWESAFPNSHTEWTIHYGSGMDDNFKGFAQDLMRVGRREGEVFTQPNPDDYKLAGE